MVTTIQSAAVHGIDCLPICVEVDVTGAWPNYSIVGLPDTAIQEAKERIKAAWKNSGLTFPNNKRILINLAPADVRKVGAVFDLPMAVGMFLADQKIQISLSDSLFVGELGLDGTLRRTNGVLSVAMYAAERGFKHLFIPEANVKEASLIQNIIVYPVQSFTSVIRHLTNKQKIVPAKPLPTNELFSPQTHGLDMADIKGQEFVKRGLEIAASGAHNILLSGPPGSGKTLLARTLPSILPRLTMAESIEITKIYSVAGLLTEETPLVTLRPFRAPHHTSSGVALVGGGKFPKPGEISLSHRGVLFLDEFPEFPRLVLDNLRQPLEDGVVTISRAQGTISFPARFTLVASQNPCPCGFATDQEKSCVCSTSMIERYQKKISGPILDRIDIHVEVPRVSFEKLSTPELAETSNTIRDRVEEARERQSVRFRGLPCSTNADMRHKDVKLFCQLNEESLALLRQAMNTLHLSARGYHRVLKLARTIADLDKQETISLTHVAEALQFRDRQKTLT